MQSHSLPHYQRPSPPPILHNPSSNPLFPQAQTNFLKPQPPPIDKIQNHSIPLYAPPKPLQNRYNVQHQDKNYTVDPLDVYQASVKRMNSNMLNNSKLDKISKDLTKEEGQKLLEAWKKNYFADFNSWVQAAKVKISIEESDKVMNNKNFKMHICSIRLAFEEEPKSQFNSSGFGPKKRDAKKMALEKLVADLIQSGNIKRGLYKGKSFCSQEIPKPKIYGVKQEDTALHDQSIVRKNSQKMQFHLKNDNFIEACQVLSSIMRRKQPDWNEVSFIWSYGVLQKNLGYLKTILDVIQNKVLPSNSPNTIKTKTHQEERIKNELLSQYGTTRLANENLFDVFDALNVDINLPEIDHLEEITDQEFLTLKNNKSFLQKDLSHYLKLSTQNVKIPSPPCKKPHQNLHIESDYSTSLDQSQNLSTRSHSAIEFEDLINSSFASNPRQILQKKFVTNNSFLTNSISADEDGGGKSADDSLLFPEIQSSPLQVSDFSMAEDENKIILENKYKKPVTLSYKLVEQMYETLIYCGDIKFAIAASELIYSQVKVNPSDFLNTNACAYYSYQKNLLFNTLLDNIDKSLKSESQQQTVQGVLRSIGKANAIEVFEFKSTQDLNHTKQYIHKYRPRNLQDTKTDKVSPGDFILLSQDAQKILGYVKNISADYALKIFTLLTIDQSRNIQNNDKWEVQKLTSKFQTDKLTETLETFTTVINLNPTVAEIIQSSPHEDSMNLRRLCKTITNLPKGSHQETRTNLNPSQQRAMKCATYETLTLIEGPSGSGKTITAIEIVIEWLRHSSLPILICAESDSYCDKIFAELVGTGMNAMRVGAGYDYINASDEAEIQNVLNQSQIHDENKNYETLKNRLLENKIRQTQIVCTTSANFISEYFAGLTLHRAIIVEACRLTELSCIAPILKGCQQLVLFGDQKGVKSNKEIASSWVESKGKNVSLFERLVVKQGIVPHFLDTEYRMHSSLRAFSSYYFYNGQMKIGLEEDESLAEMIGGLAWPNPNIRAIFINIKGEEKSYKSSIVNEQEIEATLRILISLLKNKDINSKDVSLITTCEAQKIKLQNEIAHQARQYPDILDLPVNQRHSHHHIKSPIDVEILDNTESLSNKDFIIFSAVRCNSLGNLGSLRDPRRLNLLLSRAKRGLIVIGDMETLATSEHWKEWINWCKINKIILDYSQDDSL